MVLFQKLFKGYMFCFLGDSFGRYIFELFARETNLKKKRSVHLCSSQILSRRKHAELMPELTMHLIKKKERKLEKIIIPFEIQNFTPVTKACSVFFVSNYKVCWCTYIPLEYGLASQHKISLFITEMH